MAHKKQQIVTESERRGDRAGSVEDISLSDVCQALGRQRKLIIGIVIASVIATTLVALFLPSMYRSESVILPPRALHVQRLNVPDLYRINTEELYARIVRNLKSSGLRHKFFIKNNLYEKLQSKKTVNMSEYDFFLEKFDEMMKVGQDSLKGGDGDFITVTFDGEDQGLLSEWLAGFIAFVDEYTVKNVTKAIYAKIHREKIRLREKIQGLRNTAKSRRQDRIAALKEAANIAKQLGLSGDSGVLYSYQHQGGKANSILVIGEEVPGYLRGAKALLAEAEALQERKSDDPFIKELRGVQEQLAFFEKLQVVPINEVHALRIDQPAVTLEKPIRPNRKLILALGLLIGLSFGFLVGLMREFIVNSTCCES